MNYSQHISIKIRIMRIKRGLNMGDLAHLIGVSRQQVSKYESNKDRVSIDRLNDIADALDVPLTYFLENPLQRSTKNETDQRRAT